MKIELQLEERAQRLLDSLDARYFLFVTELPSPLDEIAQLESTIVGQSGEGRFKGPSTLNPLIAWSPWLFWELFGSLEDEVFLKVAETGMLLSLASVVMDHVVDGQAEHPAEMALLQHTFYAAALSGLRSIFPTTSPFWPDFERLSSVYRMALGMEIHSRFHPDLLTKESFDTFAGGKVSPMVITIAAMATLTDQTWAIEPIERSFHYAFIAGQIHDDVLDWRLDQTARHLTFFLTCLAPVEAWRDGRWPENQLLEETNSVQWLDVEYFSEVMDTFDRSAEAVNEIPCSGWRSYLQTYRSVAERHQRAAVASHLLRIIDPVDP
jgi:hypothetical protein